MTTLDLTPTLRPAAVAAEAAPATPSRIAGDEPVMAGRDLVVRFGPHTALSGVSIDLHAGEILGLLGPNGAGKTTLIRRLAGVLAGAAGEVRVAGADPAISVAARALIGYLPEEPPLYNDQSALSYVTYMAALAGEPRKTRRAAATEALARVGADGFARRLTGRLSKGQRQRVGLAAAIVHEPKVLLLDEPTSGFDPLQRVTFRDLLVELAGSSTILFSTHVLGEVQAVCDRIVVLDQGAVAATQTVGADRARLRVRVDGAGPGEVSALLAALPGVAEVTAEGVCAVADPAVSNAIATAVVARGWILRELAPVPDDLEQTFLEIIAGRTS